MTGHVFQAAASTAAAFGLCLRFSQSRLIRSAADRLATQPFLGTCLSASGSRPPATENRQNCCWNATPADNISSNGHNDQKVGRYPSILLHTLFCAFRIAISVGSFV